MSEKSEDWILEYEKGKKRRTEEHEKRFPDQVKALRKLYKKAEKEEAISCRYYSKYLDLDSRFKRLVEIDLFSCDEKNSVSLVREIQEVKKELEIAKNEKINNSSRGQKLFQSHYSLNISFHRIPGYEKSLSNIYLGATDEERHRVKRAHIYGSIDPYFREIQGRGG